MKRFIIRLFHVAVLLYGILGFGIGVKAQELIHDRFNDEEQITKSDDFLKPMAEEPQSPVEAVSRVAPSSHRIATIRSSRLLPTYSGKLGKNYGQWSTNEINNPFKNTTLQLCRSLNRLRIIATPPRLYYVIALRRLLC